MIIQEATVEKVIGEVSSNESYSEEIRGRFNEKQEDYLAYLEREVYSLISDPEKDLLLFMLYALHECILEEKGKVEAIQLQEYFDTCLLYTSPSPRDLSTSRMPSSA